MSEVISSFKSLRAGSQVFSLLVLFICVIFPTMWSGKSMQFLCILPFGMLCVFAISMMFVKLCWQCIPEYWKSCGVGLELHHCLYPCMS